jgi:hypothetical protein
MTTPMQHNGQTHHLRFDLANATSASCDGHTVRKARTPILTLARVLVASGYDPDSIVLCFTANGTPSIRGRLGTLARLTVREDDHVTRFEPYRAPTTAVGDTECDGEVDAQEAA